MMTSQPLQRAGLTTATDAIRSVSADGAGSIGTGFQSGFSAGGSAVSLRGLGVSSTLVLIDGLRSANFPINGNIGNVFNANAPVAPAAYASAPNYLTTFHYPGLIGQTFKVGVRFTY